MTSERFLVQQDLPADDAGVGAEAAPPDALAQQERRRSAGGVVLAAEDPTEKRPRAEQREELRIDADALQMLRLVPTDQVGRERMVGGHRLEGRARPFPVPEVRQRRLHARAPGALGVRPDVNQPIRIGERQRPEEDVIRDGERRGDGADAESRDPDRGRREPGRAAEGAQRIADVRAKDVGVDPRRGREHAGDLRGEDGEARRGAGARPRGLVEAPREDPPHLPAVLGAERRRKEPQQRTVDSVESVEPPESHRRRTLRRCAARSRWLARAARARSAAASPPGRRPRRTA